MRVSVIQRLVLSLLSFSVGVALVGAGAAMFGGCRAKDASSSNAVSAPRAGGELVFAFDGASLTQFTLDPHKSAFAPHNRVFRSIYDSLVVAKDDHAVGPWLATSWTISDDRLTYTFKLKEGVTFHDGTAFDAQAVKDNFDRVLAPKNAFPAATNLGPVAKTEVVDAYTVKVILSEPYEPLLVNLSKTDLAIVSPTAARKYGDEFPTHPVGTGPFRFKSLTPGTEIRLERNPSYQWAASTEKHRGPPLLDALVFRNVPEESTRVAALESGQAQAADIIPPQNIVALKNDPAYQIVSRELLNENYSLYLNIKRAPWSDENVRQAIRLSLDLDAAVKTIYLGTFSRAWSPISPSIFGYDATLEGSWRPDPSRATALLEAAGWKRGADGIREKDGKRLTLVFLDTQGNREKRLDLVTVLRRQLRDAGVELRIETQPGGNYLQRVQQGDYDMTAGSLFAPDPDVMRRLFSPVDRSLSSISKVDDPELGRWLVEGYREADPAKRRALYAKIQRRILDRVYAIPTYVLLYTIAASRDVHDLAIDVHGFPTFLGTWLSR